MTNLKPEKLTALEVLLLLVNEFPGLVVSEDLPGLTDVVVDGAELISRFSQLITRLSDHDYGVLEDCIMANASDEYANNDICSHCSGSGMGYTDNSSCIVCHGTGSSSYAHNKQEELELKADYQFDQWKDNKNDN